MSDNNTYKIYADGGARGNPGPAAYGFVIYDSKNNIVIREGKKIGINTNNVAEYMGVIAALKWVKENKKKVDKILFFLDSQLVAYQLNGLYKVKSESLRNLFFTIKALEVKLNTNITYSAIAREMNKEADKMVNLALDES